MLFRPEANAERMAEGAARLSMVPPPKELFLEAVRATVEANAAFVPPQGKGSLYLRPLLVGSGPILGLGPAPSYTLVVYCASVGSYFKGGQLTPIDLIVEEQFHRSAPGGMGGTKCAGNYSPVLVTQVRGGPGIVAVAVWWWQGLWQGLWQGPRQGPAAWLSGSVLSLSCRPASLSETLRLPCPLHRPCLLQLAAKKEGYSDVVYLDAKTDTYLEEVSSCNIFVVKGKTIRTPPLQVRGGAQLLVAAAAACCRCCVAAAAVVISCWLRCAVDMC